MGYLTEQLAKKKYLLSSGAWATELARRGYKHEHLQEVWNTENPEAVRELAQAYAKIPVDLLGTNTFAANRFNLEKYGLGDHTASINYAGARIAYDALQGQGAVCGSIGPISAYMQKHNEAKLVEAYKQQAIALHTGGAKVLWLETMISVDEAFLAVKTLKKCTPCDVICTFSPVKGKLGYGTHCGMFAQDALREVAKANPDAMGFNCVKSPTEVFSLNSEIEKSGAKNVYKVFKPNAGLPDENGFYPFTPETFAIQMRHALDKSFTIIGGCCGAGPEYIAELKMIYPQ